MIQAETKPKKAKAVPVTPTPTPYESGKAAASGKDAPDCPFKIEPDTTEWFSGLIDGLRALVVSKDGELAAHHKRVNTEKSLASKVRAAESDVECAKSEVGAAKQRLADAQTALSEFVWGDVQTSFLPKDDDQGVPAHFIVEHEDQHVLVGDYPNLAHVDELRQAGIALPETGTPSIGESVVSFMDRPFAVMDKVCAASGALLVHMLPLYDTTEWFSLHASNYGNPVEGIDQSDEAKRVRQVGGPHCGRVVKAGRKKYVIGPQRDAIVVELPAAVEPETLTNGDEDDE